MRANTASAIAADAKGRFVRTVDLELWNIKVRSDVLANQLNL